MDSTFSSTIDSSTIDAAAAEPAARGPALEGSSATLAIIDRLSAATGYALGPFAREILRRIKYAALGHRPGDILEPLGN